MATLTITFTPPMPTPANGYIIKYRLKGSVGAYSTTTAASSPAVITGLATADYEGTIQSDCGAEVSAEVPFETSNYDVVVCKFYKVTNTDSIVRNYTWNDCTAVEDTEPLDPGESINICAQEGSVTGSDASVVITEIGDCAAGEPLDFEAENTLEGATITTITPGFYVIANGSYPMSSGDNVNGTHGGLTGTISVVVTIGINTGRIKLFIDGVETDCQDVNSSDTYDFTGVSLTANTHVRIVLEAGTC
jgi:hypothetical protein